MALFLCERMANTFEDATPSVARARLVDARREFLKAATTQEMPTKARAAERFAELEGTVDEDMPGWEDYAACLAYGYRVLASADFVALASIVGRVLEYVGSVAEEWDPGIDVTKDYSSLVEREWQILQVATERLAHLPAELRLTDVQRELDEASKLLMPRLPPAV
jgi:hypothetical protein